jgi:serine/threonine-protein kinase
MQRSHSVARFGEYDVIAPLARGGMGDVFLAAHARTGERVALKVLDIRFARESDIVARLYAERAVSARASHPGLVSIRAAAATPDAVPFLVMEYLDGEPLADVVARAPLPLDRVPAIGAQIADALAALHAAGFVHCDVKPDNVVMLADGRVKVIDFGVARAIDEAPSEDATIAGTPAYMAPEQWRGRPQPASDVYSLGCLLYELVTGDVPFSGSLPELMARHAEQRPPRPSWLRDGLSIALERPIARALAKDADLRPTARALADELAAVADGWAPALRIAV